MTYIKNNIVRRNILETIGQTPLVKLHHLYPQSSIRLFAKMEAFNPGGSIKDRTAFSILKEALQEGKLTKETTIVESSSGNMAIGLAQACRYFGLPLIVVVDPKVNAQTVQILKVYGAKLEHVTQPLEDGGYLGARLQRVQQLLQEIPNSFWTNQYANPNNPIAHHQTMKEILEAMDESLDYLFAATSTCGTIRGCSDYVKQHGLSTKIIAVDAVGSVIFGQAPQKRLIPGHGAGRPSQLLKKESVHRPIHITDQECIIGCRRLIDRESILAGGSSGANVMAVEKMLPYMPSGSTVAIILCDRGERYLDTIYSDKWVKENFGTINIQEASSQIGGTENGHKKKANDSAIRNIAIIGGGPKGTYALERLAAQLKVNPSPEKVNIDVFNRNDHFGAGDNYRPDQPDYWLINYSIGNINMWIDEKPEAVVTKPLNLENWLQKKKPKVQATDYASRAKVGEYLSAGFQEILSNLPDTVEVNCKVGEVVDILPAGEKYKIIFKDKNFTERTLPNLYENILLTTGHPRPKNVDFPAHLFHPTSSAAYVPFIYPVKNLNSVQAASNVAVKGMGLTFIDAVLALTEGRGGRFERNELGELKYVSSGNEPSKIYPFSRSGVPILPRAPFVAEQNATHDLRFFDIEKIQLLASGKIDFEQEIWNVIEQEMIYTYYSTLFQNLKIHPDFATYSFSRMQEIIQAFHNKNYTYEIFKLDIFLFPLKNKSFAAADKQHDFVMHYMNNATHAAKIGENQHPFAAVTSVWRKIAPLFRKLYEFGGLKPSAQQTMLENYYSALTRVTYGPPICNMEKILALVKSKHLYFGFSKISSIKFNEKEQFFQLHTSHDSCVSVDVLIDARIPKFSLNENDSSLYQNMLHRGLIRPFQNTSEKNIFEPGCLDVVKDGGYIIGADGLYNDSIAAMGTPTEGITFDNDSLSRHCNNFASKWAMDIAQSIQEQKISSKNRHLLFFHS